MSNCPHKILVVDDDRPLVQLTTFVLEGAGYQVRGAISGREALRQVSEDIPDLDFTRCHDARFDRY
jgi:CheY-like chemotaxis protein